MSQRLRRSYPLPQSFISSVSSSFKHITSARRYRLNCPLSMRARWFRPSVVLSVLVLAAFVFHQGWRETVYPNVTLDALPVPARDLFSCFARPHQKWSHYKPYCCAKTRLGDGDCHEATHWANVQLQSSWWRPKKTERWWYCDDGLVPWCCFYHFGDELAGQGLYCGGIVQSLEKPLRQQAR
ncbi:hypothetical protein B0H63DRAFT_464183 [Podospora didyma]|uniref:Uncharacterized protein n=1 Tax=Podospora didyma TaxID=330526 RepID=A0AAE0NXV1_9PEZI|nr:hypothetical protein B0H63DRAFT_464183 [Podospora didyma]